ncbi:MAG: type II secretion system minor pseudopilin GspK, partial [Moraxellaceae bacterium]
MPKRPDLPRRYRMHGVALITVLLIVALAVLLTAGMVRRQHQALRHAEGLFSQDQAVLYTVGAEAFARDLLARDSEDDKRKGREVDSLGETWARPLPPFPVDGGVLNARISDLQGRFNLNRLWRDNAADEEALAIFRRLLAALDLPEALAPALRDWLDPDSEADGIDGAEDDFYTRLAVPYRAANRPLADVSELRLVRGFTADAVERLRPYVAALPANAGININTADAVVLQALADSLSATTARDVAEKRPEKGYASVQEFLAEPVFNGLDQPAKARLQSQLAVRTRWFELAVDADIGGRHSVLHAMLVRDQSGTL